MRSAMLACSAALIASAFTASSSGDLHTNMCTHTHVHDCTACNMMLRMIIDTPHLHTPFSMHHPDYSVLSNMIARMQIDTPHVHMSLSIHNEYILLFSIYRSARHDLISRPARVLFRLSCLQLLLPLQLHRLQLTHMGRALLLQPLHLRHRSTIVQLSLLCPSLLAMMALLV